MELGNEDADFGVDVAAETAPDQRAAQERGGSDDQVQLSAVRLHELPFHGRSHARLVLFVCRKRLAENAAEVDLCEESGR